MVAPQSGIMEVAVRSSRPGRLAAGRCRKWVMDSPKGCVQVKSAAHSRPAVTETRRHSHLVPTAEVGTVAVGTRVTSRLPHRSVRAAFPHTVPTLGIHGDYMLPYASQHL